MDLDPKDKCLCGHKAANHFNASNCWDCKWEGIIPNCKKFKLDNLTFIERLAEQKNLI